MISTVLETFALVLELVSAAVVILGAAAALLGGVKGLRSDRSGMWKRGVWLHFAAWIILGLEFALGADIIRTIVAPTWDELGKLAVLATIRTALNYFLSRDLDEFRPSKGA